MITLDGKKTLLNEGSPTIRNATVKKAQGRERAQREGSNRRMVYQTIVPTATVKVESAELSIEQSMRAAATHR